MAYTRAQGKIALGSASTALAATLYKYFETTHSLFKFPVVEELDIIRPQFTNRMWIIKTTSASRTTSSYQLISLWRVPFIRQRGIWSHI